MDCESRLSDKHHVMSLISLSPSTKQASVLACKSIDVLLFLFEQASVLA